MPAEPAAMFRLSCVRSLRHARTARAAQKVEPSEATRYLLRARSSQPLGFPGAAAKTFVPDAGNVGIAGNFCREAAEPGQFHATALHYCDGLHRPRDAWPGAGDEQRTMGAQEKHPPAASDWIDEKNPARGSR